MSCYQLFLLAKDPHLPSLKSKVVDLIFIDINNSFKFPDPFNTSDRYLKRLFKVHWPNLYKRQIIRLDELACDWYQACERNQPGLFFVYLKYNWRSKRSTSKRQILSISVDQNQVDGCMVRRNMSHNLRQCLLRKFRHLQASE